MTRRSALVFFLVLVVGCGKGQGDARRPDEPLGRVTEVTGQVDVLRPGLQGDHAIKGMEVTRDMTFRTAAAATVTVRFWNNYTWSLAESSEVKIAGLSVIDKPRNRQLAGSGKGEAVGAAGREGEASVGDTAATAPKDQSKSEEQKPEAAATPPAATLPAATPPAATPSPAEPTVAAPPEKPPAVTGQTTTRLPPGATGGSKGGGGSGGSATITASPTDLPAEGPDHAAILKEARRLRPRMQRCLATAGSQVRVRVSFTVAATGRVTEVSVMPPEQAGVAGCMRAALAGLTVPEWDGESIGLAVDIVSP